MQYYLSFRGAAALALGISLTVGFTLESRANDWPRWRGPNLDGISGETGWMKKWPAQGPARLWEASLGVGYSSFAVADGRVYTMGNASETDSVYCFDAENGQLKWKHEYPCTAKDPQNYLGTRCTPTVDKDRVYTLSRRGHFFCLDAASGRVIWSKDFTKDFGGKFPNWGFSGSPLIEKDWVLTEVSGPGISVAAFQKSTGELVWKNGDEAAGYSSLIPFDLAGERCFAQFSYEHMIGRRMKDGSQLWKRSWETEYGVNAATPLIHGDEMFLSSGYGYGCAMLKMSPDGLKELWRNKNMRNHVNSCVWLDGYLYGYDENQLKCLDAKTGEVKWATGAYGKGALMAADGTLVVYGQAGKLGLAEASPKQFTELCSFQALSGRDTWASPVLANGRIYVRSLDKAAAFDVRVK